MKKVYEFSVSETTTESYDNFDGLVDHVIDPFDGEEPLNLQDNAVKLEKGQEAVFKVTVTTTVELIDVRMAETWSKAEVAAVKAKADEDEHLFHADGCSFFYGNGCGCGFEAKHIGHIKQPLTEAQKSKLADIIPTTQAPPRPETPCHLDWGPSRCGLSHKQLVESRCTWTSDPRLVTCPDCLKAPQSKRLVWECASCKKQSAANTLSPLVEGYVLKAACPCDNGLTDHALKALQPKTDELPKYEWWCSVCGRIEAIPGLKAEHEGRIGSCVTCTNNIAAPQRSTMRVRQSPS